MKKVDLIRDGYYKRMVVQRRRKSTFLMMRCWRKSETRMC